MNIREETCLHHIFVASFVGNFVDKARDKDCDKDWVTGNRLR